MFSTTFWDITNLANWGTILGGLAVIITGMSFGWRRFLRHLREEILPVTNAVTRNSGSSMADAVHRIESKQQHIHSQINKMENKLDRSIGDFNQHIGWHKGTE